MKTAVLLAGFGGPESLNDVEPFLSSVLEGVQIPAERRSMITERYQSFGGVSPYGAQARAQKQALEKALQKHESALPVFLGFRHASPSFEAIAFEFKRQSFEKIVVFVLSPLRSYPSFGKYEEKISQAFKTAGLKAQIAYTEPFYPHPLFHSAQSNRIELALRAVPKNERPQAFFLFTAHSIPAPLAQTSRYAEEFQEASFLIAKNLNQKNWGIAYQSRSGSPREPWLEPGICEALKGLNKLYKHVIVVPAEFVVENLELLYDLDVEAKSEAEKLGLVYHRALTVSDDPDFIEMMCEVILKADTPMNLKRKEPSDDLKPMDSA